MPGGWSGWPKSCRRPRAPTAGPRRSGSISVAELLELRRHTTALSHVAFSGGPAIMTISGRGEASRLQGMRVAPGMFETLGVPPLFGRGFDAAEEARGETPSSCSAIPHGSATSAAIPGSSVETSRSRTASRPTRQPKVYTVVGMMPRGFEFADAQMQFWIPVSWTPSARGSMMGRLAPWRVDAGRGGGSWRRPFERCGTRSQSTTYELVPARDGVVESVKPALLMLTVASAFVLLIACVNVGNLLFARSVTRRREIAVRAALGAGRGRLIRLLLTESVMLGLLGGLGGTLLAVGGVRLLKTLATTLAPHGSGSPAAVSAPGRDRGGRLRRGIRGSPPL